MRECFVERRFGHRAVLIITAAEAICREFAEKGYELTLRQLYYQFVARQPLPFPFPNTMRSYKNLGSIVNDARLAGLLDWRYIVDRTRNVNVPSAWDSPSDIIKAAWQSYRRKIWDEQPVYVEAWIEKDALIGVLERACDNWRIPSFSCRGYTSQSEMYGGAKRLLDKLEEGKRVLVLHLGDHDPSGVDMSRDIEDRVRMFMDGADDEFELRRIALTMLQVKEVKPPPNPAKITDSRYHSYTQQFGQQSWELDALSPEYVGTLINSHMEGEVDREQWDKDIAIEEEERSLLFKCSNGWPRVVKLLKKMKEPKKSNRETL